MPSVTQQVDREQQKVTQIKNRSYFEHIQFHRAKMSGTIDSLYDSDVKERLKSNVDFEMHEMYNLSQVTQKEVDTFPNKKESQVFEELRKLRKGKKKQQAVSTDARE